MEKNKIVLKGNLCSSKPVMKRTDNKLLLNKIFKVNKLKKMLKSKSKHKR
jgi:hypothetical protein